jgi:hypothetical protein
VQETTTSSNIIPERMAGRYEDMLTVLAFVEEDMQQDRREEFSALFSRVNAEISRIRLVKSDPLTEPWMVHLLSSPEFGALAAACSKRLLITFVVSRSRSDPMKSRQLLGFPIQTLAQRCISY